MKRFWHIIGVWFVLQLVLLSVGDAMHSAVAADQHITGDQLCAQNGTQTVNPMLAGVVGLLFPLTETTFVTGEWCWQHDVTGNSTGS